MYSSHVIIKKDRPGLVLLNGRAGRNPSGGISSTTIFYISWQYMSREVEGKMKKVLCAMLALSMSLALSGCFLAPAVLSGGETTKTTVKAAPAKMGDTVKGDKWGITLQSAKLFDEIKMNDLMSDKPEEGKQFLILFFEVENVSGEDDYFNYFYVEGYVDGYSQDMKILLSKPDGADTLTGDVAAGKKMKGQLTWEVSKGWKEFEVSYKNDPITSAKAATFKITPSDIAK